MNDKIILKMYQRNLNKEGKPLLKLISTKTNSPLAHIKYVIYLKERYFKNNYRN